MTECDLYGATLKDVLLERCELREATLSGATLERVELRECDLTRVRGRRLCAGPGCRGTTSSRTPPCSPTWLESR